MRVSLYKCHCPIICCSKCYLPCLVNSKDAHHVSSAPNPVAVVVVNERASDERVSDGERRVDEGKEEVLLRSSLKKQPDSDSNEAGKGNVKWRDFLGKELVEIREFEPIESGESEDGADDNSSCMCVIQ